MPDAPHRLANISRGIHPPLGTSLVRGGGAEGSAALTLEADRADALAWLMPGTGGVWSDRTLLRVDTSAWSAFSALNMTFGNGAIRTNFVFQGAGALRVTQLTTTQRDGLFSVANGMIIYNTTSNELQARINGAWVALGSGGGATTLDGLSDVVIAAPATGELLRYNGTNWVNSVLQGTRSILFEINDDATAGTNEDPSLILSGGNGSTVLVNSALVQDSSAQTVFLYTTANGTVANHTFALGRPNATSTTSRTTTLQLYAADGATERSHSLVMATGGGLTWTIPSGIGNSFVLTDGFRNYLAVSPNTQAVVMGSGSGATFSFGLVPSALNAFAVSDYLYVHTDTTNRRVAIGTATTLQVGSFTTTQRDALSTLVNGMLLYNTTSNELQARINGAWVALGAGGGGTLDAAYDFGGAGAGRTITVDSGAIRLSYPDAADTHYALEIAYGAQAFTGTPHGILVDWTAATSLNNAADVYGINLIGETNAGAGDSIGIRLDGWDQDIEIAGNNIHIGNGGGPAGSKTILLVTNLTGTNAGQGQDCVYIGDNIAGGNGDDTVAIGSDITGASGSQRTGVGHNVSITGAGGTAVGWTAGATASSTCAFGYNARAAHNFSIAIGRQSVTSAASQIMIGSSATNFTDFCVGGGNVSTTEQGITIRPSDGSSAAGWDLTLRGGNGGGTDEAGGNVTINGGRGTGAAAGGVIDFGVARVGAPGTSLNTITRALRIEPLDFGGGNTYIGLFGGLAPASNPPVARTFYEFSCDVNGAHNLLRVTGLNADVGFQVYKAMLDIGDVVVWTHGHEDDLTAFREGGYSFCAGSGLGAPETRLYIDAFTGWYAVDFDAASPETDHAGEAIQSYAQTADNTTWTTIQTIAMPNDTVISIYAQIIGTDSSGDTNIYHLHGGARNAAGTVAVIGTPNIIAQETDASWNVRLQASGGNILIQVLGDATNPGSWKCKTSYTMFDAVAH